MKSKLSTSIMPNLNRLAKAATVAALTLGMAVVAQPAQKASAQVLGRVSITPLSGYAWEGGNGKQVTYVSSNRHINELYVGKGGTWQYADLTQIAGEPPAVGAISGYAIPVEKIVFM